MQAAALHHRDHLRLTWELVRQHDLETALGLVKAQILAYAYQAGRIDQYHETLTRFWVRMVAQAVKQHPALDFEALLAVCPELLDKHLPFRYWSQETFWSPAARAAWVEPDRCCLPDSCLDT